MKKHILALCLATAACLPALADTAYPQKSNIPTLYIETENGAPIQSKNGDYVNAVLHLVDGDDVTVYDALGIRGRGNSTWGLAKKPYKIKFTKKQEFLGPDRAKAKSWTLLANHADKTLMRNAVAACIGSFAGQPFTAAAKFVDVVLNGQYQGNYQISDQVEIRPKRVDITEQEEGLGADANITGGYFLEVDGFASSEPVYITTNKGVDITIKSPDEDIISPAQIAYIKGYINRFEDALFSNDFTDPETGYRQYVDESTLASWYISSELTGNVDCFWSTYIYKEKDDPKIYWGPLWDYDIAFNNCNRTGEVTNALMLNKGFGDNLTKVWVKRMWQDPWFANLINTTWKELVEKGIEEHVLHYISNTAELLEESQRLNFAKWKIDERAYNEIKLFSTYSEGVDYLKAFISGHVRYLTTAFEQAAASLTPPAPFEAETDYYYTISNRGCGQFVDIDDNAGICIWTPTAGRQTQHWRFEPDGEGNYRIINRYTEKAITDNAKHNGNKYDTGTQLAQADIDLSDRRQLWSIAPASNENGMGHVIANVESGLAWNNAGGVSKDGNSILSWTNDYQNPSKHTRQWFINRTEDKMSGSPAAPVNPVEYAVSYDPASGVLHFTVYGEGALEGSASIVSTDGRTLATFAIAESVDISSLPKGMCILAWTVAGKTRTVKFVR